ncbi:PEP/pyruvate-binding domain-containing protein [Smaragdicoccus niigatensis]|uniref:PEP/pyruvate-binding domain-containing protein n=1 Tax=Smaragdicoccus niigatensis TaxID=359359 RepID=UPI00058CCF0C|nr:PEP/pyruvate-binding domain-containing protein [Smaragdicoccus niigatensis]
MNSGFVVALDSLDAAALPLAGGKAANLGELLRAGFDVPGGFAVTTDAYSKVASGLDEVIGSSGGGDLAGTARTALLAAAIPADVALAICSAYAELGDDIPVAVRSSATAEDLPTASFAGQQDTFLNVVGAENVLDAVRRCWSSLWTDRAVSYRETVGIDHSAVRLAVVVQQMVDAKVAGVLFTADPVTGRRTYSVIDASPGLGESVVSGAVNPDHFVVADGGDIVDRRLGDKKVVVRALPGGGTETVTGVGVTEPALDDVTVRELALLGRQVEAHFGAPQDIEWALDGDGCLWLTQSRPITTLYPVPVSTRPGPRVFFNGSLAQGLTRPITPMGLSAFRAIAATPAREVFGIPGVDPLLGPPAFLPTGARAFIDITAAVRSRPGRALAIRMLGVMEARSAAVLRDLGAEPEFAIGKGTVAPFLRGVARAMVKYRVPILVAKSLAKPEAGRAQVAKIGRDLRSHLVIPASATAQERLDHVQEVLSGAFPILPRTGPVAFAGFLAFAAARKFVGSGLDGVEWHEVMRSLPHNSTTEMDLTLWRLATRLREDPESARALHDGEPAELAAKYLRGELPTIAQEELRAFLREHGHRAIAEIDVGMPRWRDDPTYVLGVLANYLRLDDPEREPDALFSRGAAAAEAAVADVVARVQSRSKVRARAVRFALGRVRELAGMREEHKDLLILLLAHVREQLGLVGRALAERDLLEEADDVFFLELVEVRAALAGADHRAAVAARREEYARELKRRHVPRVLLSDGTEPEAVAAAPLAGDGLIGTPASAGTVTARARVVLDPVGAYLEPGEILVAPSTDPGWTPLFLTAGGLVMEMGGANSHGAVVAREYGIPAVVGAADATRRIETGQEITVDGASGLVRFGR